MEFIITYNQDGSSKYYYVNNKRVSKDNFEWIEINCNISGGKYNSSYTKINKRTGRIEHHFCYNR